MESGFALLKMGFKYCYTISFVLSILTQVVACKSHYNDVISIQFDRQCNCVTVNNVPATELTALKNDTLTLQSWQLLFPVYIMPKDTALRNYQQPVTGSYKIHANQLVFTPDTPFNFKQTYFARYYQYSNNVSLTDLLIKKHLPDKPVYTELIFK